MFHSVITDISRTYGCTTVSYDKRPTKPGDILQVGIKMTPKNTGFFDETVKVKSNIEQSIKLKLGEMSCDRTKESLFLNLEAIEASSPKYPGKEDVPK